MSREKMDLQTTVMYGKISVYLQKCFLLPFEEPKGVLPEINFARNEASR